MNRLTERDEYGNSDIIGVDSEDLQLNLDFEGFNRVTEALNRLAAYEDTGLEPEEMRELLHDSTGPLHKKLGEWIDAEQEGRLLVLPCKEGEKVYDIISGKIQEKYYNLHGYRDEDFGIVVFLTRQDAEKALEVANND